MTTTAPATRSTPLSRVWSGRKTIAEDLTGEDLTGEDLGDAAELPTPALTVDQTHAVMSPKGATAAAAVPGRGSR